MIKYMDDPTKNLSLEQIIGAIMGGIGGAITLLYGIYRWVHNLPILSRPESPSYPPTPVPLNSNGNYMVQMARDERIATTALWERINEMSVMSTRQNERIEDLHTEQLMLKAKNSELVQLVHELETDNSRKDERIAKLEAEGVSKDRRIAELEAIVFGNKQAP